MFSLTFILALPLLAAATAVPRDDPSNQCNTGSLQCCNSVQSVDSSLVSFIADINKISLNGVTGQVGLTCSPLTGIGLAGNSCTDEPVCCTGNNFDDGLIVVGCSPINVNL